MSALTKILPKFPAYATPLDKLGWWAPSRNMHRRARVFCCCLPILVIIPLSFSDSSFLVYPIPGWSMKWYDNLFSSAEWARAAKNSFIVAPAATRDCHGARHTGCGRPCAHDLPVQRAVDEPADSADGRAHRGRRCQHLSLLCGRWAWLTATPV